MFYVLSILFLREGFVIYPLKLKSGVMYNFYFFFNRHYNPGWVSACSSVVEHSRQGGFTECLCQRHVKPQLGGEPGI
jgi:hypothetical protein